MYPNNPPESADPAYSKLVQKSASVRLRLNINILDEGVVAASAFLGQDAILAVQGTALLAGGVRRDGVDLVVPRLVEEELANVD